MKNILIFEGMDRTGKSEIGTELSKVLGWTYYKNKNEQIRFDEGVDAKTLFKCELNVMLNVIDQFTFSGLILDRSTPSEYVYAKALNRDFDEDLVWKADEILADMGAKIVYCYKPAFAKNEYNDEFISEDLKDTIEFFYADYLSKTKMQIVMVNTSSYNIKNELNQIFESGILI